MYKNVHSTVVLLVTVQAGNNTVVAWIKKLWYTHTVDRYSVIIEMNSDTHDNKD